MTLTSDSCRREDAGTRLDAWLAASVDGLTRSAAARLHGGGAASPCDGTARRPRTTASAGGETVTVDAAGGAGDRRVEPQDIPLDVVYEDEDVIVVNKPVGAGGASGAGAPGRHAGQRPAAPLRRRRCPASAGRSGPASSIASTGTPAGSSSPPRTTPPIWGSAPSSATTRWPGRTSVWWWAT